MDFITAYAVYMTVAVLVVGLWALRVPHENVKIVFILSMVWPLSLTAIAGILLLDVVGWNMDMAKGKTMFGVRKPNNPEIKGFAFTVLFQEFQFFKMR